MVPVGSSLYFAAVDPLHGQEVWRSDGTANGTQLVADINPGSSGSFPFSLRSVTLPADPRLLFMARDATQRAAVYVSDGTATGTVKLSPTS